MNLAKNKYSIIFCDIDDTIVSGFITDMMHYTWKVTKSVFLSKVLMAIQYFFNAYKVNTKLMYSLSKSGAFIIFLTARKHFEPTRMLIKRLCKEYDIHSYSIVELGSYRHTIDKLEYIERQVKANPEGKFLVVDDNSELLFRSMYNWKSVMGVHPLLFKEKVIG